jgi:iron(II)-dependent oxidoreductase
LLDLRDFILVPAGSFVMGADWRQTAGADYEEGPQREVWLSGYSIQRSPVTVAQWQWFLEKSGYTWPFLEDLADVSPAPDRPAVLVSWEDAYRFSAWLREETGEPCALPTEAQWEKACRGTDKRMFPWGNEEWSWRDLPPRSFEVPQPVGWAPDRASFYGCLDMWVNVSEWCLDWYDGDYFYEHEETTDPRGPATGEHKSFRGGNPISSGLQRCSWRGYQKPGFRHSLIGFRLVLNHEE